MPPADRAKTMDYVQKEMERVAVATLGPKGRVTVEQMVKRDRPTSRQDVAESFFRTLCRPGRCCSS